jgi:hypothetical protein
MGIVIPASDNRQSCLQWIRNQKAETVTRCELGQLAVRGEGKHF